METIRTFSKKIAISILAVIMACCAFGIVMNDRAYAEDPTAITLAELKTKGTFAMEGGAGIRLGENKGLRFTANIPADDYAGLVETYTAEKLTFGTFVLPSAYVTKYGAPSEENCFGASAVYTWNGATGSGTHTILHNVADKAVVETNGKVNGFVKDIIKENLNISYLGYCYIMAETESGVEYLFAEQSVANARSTLLVAALALESGEYPDGSDDFADINAYFTAYGKAYEALDTEAGETTYAQIEKLSTGTQLTLPSGAGAVSAVYVNGKAVSYTDNDGAITITTSEIANYHDKATVIIEAEDKFYGGKVGLIDVITNVTELEAMRAASSGHYVLANDIDMSDVTLAEQNHSFSGIFDGRGYAIKNLNYTKLGHTLFTTVSGTVKNLALSNVKIGSGLQTGAVAIKLDKGTLDNVYVSVDLSLCNHSGGFIKWIESGTNKIINSVVSVTSAAMGNSCGLIMGFGTGTLDITGTYAVKASSTATLVGARGDSYETFRDTMNALDTTATPRSFVVGDFFDKVYENVIDVDTAMIAKAGIKDTRIVISTADDFVTVMATATRYDTIILAKDIDMNDLTDGNREVQGFYNAGTNRATFSGTFDGKGHKINNLIVAKTDAGKTGGLFSEINGGTVKNLALTNVTFGSSATSASVLGVVAGQMPKGTIDNVYVSTNISGMSARLGGITGTMTGSITITNCVINITVDAVRNNMGAIIGATRSSTGTLDITGTYVIKNNSSLTNMGTKDAANETLVSDINALSNSYVGEPAFIAAGIDFSSYKAAVKNNIPS